MKDSKIDINTIIGFLLIGGIFLYFGYFNQPDPAAQPEGVTEGKDSTEVVEETRDLVEDEEPIAAEADTSGIPTPYQLARGEAELFTLENDVLEITISSHGGQIVGARLKDFQTYDSLPLYLINHSAEFNIQLEDNGVRNTADLHFDGEKTGNAVTMTLDAGDGKSLEYRYSLQPSDYMLNWDVRTVGLQNVVDANTGLQWEMQTLRHEKSRDNETNYTRIKYRYADDDDVDELSSSGEDEEEEQNIKWIAYKQQFFSSILLNKNAGFDRAAMVSRHLEEGDPDRTKFMASKTSLSDGPADLNIDLGLYLGPNKYEILKAYNQDFDELIPLGWGILGWINRGVVLTIFNWLEDYGMNYGIIILIIAILIKMVLFPLTYQSYRSMAKTRVLKPEIDDLNEKYKDQDPMKKQQAVMELYRKAGVNPLGGCIPMLLQMPILIALFRFFPASIELRQQSFLWADDLSTYDSIAQLPFHIPFYGDHVSLFTLLMTVSTLIYTYMNQQLTGSNQQYPQMKYLVYLMPVFFLGWFNNYAAGLSYYYFVANVITFAQQFAIRSFLDDEKILAKIQEKKKKPGKQNRFMRRMQELHEEQNRQARRRK